jgi:hypothetical protein
LAPVRTRPSQTISFRSHRPPLPGACAVVRVRWCVRVRVRVRRAHAAIKVDGGKLIQEGLLDFQMFDLPYQGIINFTPTHNPQLITHNVSVSSPLILLHEQTHKHSGGQDRPCARQWRDAPAAGPAALPTLRILELHRSHWCSLHPTHSTYPTSNGPTPLTPPDVVDPGLYVGGSTSWTQLGSLVVRADGYGALTGTQPHTPVGHQHTTLILILFF